MKNDSLKGQHRINEQIRAKEVRIVGDDVESAVYPIAQALKMAEDHEADLVEERHDVCAEHVEIDC
mgnify:CR=1 FL=1